MCRAQAALFMASAGFVLGGVGAVTGKLVAHLRLLQHAGQSTATFLGKGQIRISKAG
jgi:hypothetical protein